MTAHINFFVIQAFCIIAHTGVLGPISQRDLSPDFDLNLRLWS